MRELKIALMLALIFAAGVFTGSQLNRQAKPSTDPATKEAPRNRNVPAIVVGRGEPILAEMKTRFKLTREQEKQVEAILRQWAQQVRESKQQVFKERFELFERTMPLIRTNLTAEQLPAYDQMVERVRRRQRITRPEDR